MTKKLLISILVVLAAGISINFVILNNEQKRNAAIQNEKNETPALLTSFNEEMKWYSLSEALEIQEKSGKKLFIDVYTTWCGPCKWLEANTFSNTVIQEQLTKYYIPVKFNAEGNDTVTYKGVEYVNKKPTMKTGARGNTHDLTYAIAQTQQGIGYPTMVFMDKEQNIIQPISGALSAAQLEPILSFFGSDAYLTTTWEEYSKTFQSNLSSSN
ncbi:MAG: thioredoxin family protein [Fimbriimonadaceae bacterium]|nr:thioredoxin family protein [Chitinophagales bacterium]